jgi:thiamine-phosphate pyrophosphorylase
MSTIAREPRVSTTLLCYITDRKQFTGDDEKQKGFLLAKIGECATAGVDFIQLREKDLSTRDLEALARMAVAAFPAGSPTKLLINSRTDVALAIGAHGVHLPANDIPASEARVIWDRAGRTKAVIGVSVHSRDKVALAEAHGADFALFGPVFEKEGRQNPQGIAHLRQVCHRPHQPHSSMPVLALGGVTTENAALCVDAGAAGIAGIRLFQGTDVAEVVRQLRRLAG